MSNIKKKCDCDKVHIYHKEVKKMQERIERVEELMKRVTKTFEKEEWVQNEYWEVDDGVICASFINIDLDQLSVFFDRD